MLWRCALQFAHADVRDAVRMLERMSGEHHPLAPRLADALRGIRKVPVSRGRLASRCSHRLALLGRR